MRPQDGDAGTYIWQGKERYARTEIIIFLKGRYFKDLPWLSNTGKCGWINLNSEVDLRGFALIVYEPFLLWGGAILG
jgi:hypothetical protein